MKLLKFTALNDTPIWINPDTVATVRTPVDKEFSREVCTAIVLINGLQYAVQEHIESVVNYLRNHDLELK